SLAMVVDGVWIAACCTTGSSQHGCGFFRAWRLPCRTSLLLPIHRVTRVVGHAPDLAISQIETLLLFEVERAGADAAEDADLGAALVDGAVAVEGAADGEGVAAVGDRVGGDQVRGWSRAEAAVAGRLGRGE